MWVAFDPFDTATLFCTECVKQMKSMSGKITVYIACLISN